MVLSGIHTTPGQTGMGSPMDTWGGSGAWELGSDSEARALDTLPTCLPSSVQSSQEAQSLLTKEYLTPPQQ